MPKVYVKNTNVHPLRELFKGEEVVILANDFWRDKQGNKKELDIFEANDFRGQYHPTPIDGDGKMVNDPRYYKMIEMIPVDKPEEEINTEPVGFKCMAPGCKHVSPSEEELAAHAQVRHPSLESLILPEEDARLKKKAASK